MELIKIITKAIEYADRQEGSPRQDEWHSAYYGYIKGYQDANRNDTESEGQKGEETTEALHKHGVIGSLTQEEKNELFENRGFIKAYYKAAREDVNSAEVNVHWKGRDYKVRQLG